MNDQRKVSYLLRLRGLDAESVDVVSDFKVSVGSRSYTFDAVVSSEEQEDLLTSLEVLLGRTKKKLIIAVGPFQGGKTRTVRELVDLAARRLGTKGCLRGLKIFENSIYDAFSGKRVPGRKPRHLRQHLTQIPLSDIAESLQKLKTPRQGSHYVLELENPFSTTLFVDCCGELAPSFAAATSPEAYLKSRRMTRDGPGARDLAALRRVLWFAKNGDFDQAAAACRLSTLAYVLKDAFLVGNTSVILALPQNCRQDSVQRALDLYSRSSSNPLPPPPPPQRLPLAPLVSPDSPASKPDTWGGVPYDIRDDDDGDAYFSAPPLDDAKRYENQSKRKSLRRRDVIAQSLSRDEKVDATNDSFTTAAQQPERIDVVYDGQSEPAPVTQSTEEDYEDAVSVEKAPLASDKKEAFTSDADLPSSPAPSREEGSSAEDDERLPRSEDNASQRSPATAGVLEEPCLVTDRRRIDEESRTRQGSSPASTRDGYTDYDNQQLPGGDNVNDSLTTPLTSEQVDGDHDSSLAISTRSHRVGEYDDRTPLTEKMKCSAHLESRGSAREEEFSEDDRRPSPLSGSETSNTSRRKSLSVAEDVPSFQHEDRRSSVEKEININGARRRPPSLVGEIPSFYDDHSSPNEDEETLNLHHERRRSVAGEVPSFLDAQSPLFGEEELSLYDLRRSRARRGEVPEFYDEEPPISDKVETSIYEDTRRRSSLNGQVLTFYDDESTLTGELPSLYDDEPLDDSRPPLTEDDSGYASPPPLDLGSVCVADAWQSAVSQLREDLMEENPRPRRKKSNGGTKFYFLENNDELFDNCGC